MSYPVTITPKGIGYDASASPRGDYFVERSSAMYAFLRAGAQGIDPGDTKFHAFKSTDAGLTWAEQDAAHAPAIQQSVGGNLLAGATICRDGDIMYLVAPTVHASGFNVVFDGLQVWTYDLSSDAWSAPTSYSSPVPGALAVGPAPAGRNALHLVKRAAGDMLLVYNGPPEIISGFYLARIYICTWDGSTWGTPTIVPGQTGNVGAYILGRAGHESGGITHVSLWSDPDGSYSHFAVDDGGTIGSIQIVDDATRFGTDLQGERFSDFVEFGSRVGFINTSDDSTDNGKPTLYYANKGSLTPSWSSAVISSTGSFVNGSFAFQTKCTALAVVSGNLFAVWTSADMSGGRILFPPNGRYIYSSTAVGSPTGWSAEATAFANASTGEYLIPDEVGPVAGDARAYQCIAFPCSAGLAIIGCGYGTSSHDPSNADEEVTDFAILSVSPPVGGLRNSWNGGTQGVQNTFS